MTSQEDDMRKPRTWVDYMTRTNPHGLRFLEGEDESRPSGAAEGAKPEAEPESKKAGDDAEGDDKPLGKPGERALRAERDARKDLERQMNQMREAFGKALGLDSEGQKPSTEELLGQLQQQMAEMQRRDLVAQVAREAQITDADDIATIGEASTEEGMRRIASRIAAASTPSGPKPDGTQGGSGEPPRREAQPGVPRLAQAFEDAFSH